VLPTDGDLTSLALERALREAAANSYEKAAEALSQDWQAKIDGKQVERWAMCAGLRLAAEEEAEAVAWDAANGRRRLRMRQSCW